MLLEYIKSDLYRYCGNTSFKSFIKHYYVSPGFRYCFYYRICKHYKRRNKLIYLIFRLVLRHYSFKFGFDIPVNASIGFGFYIGHFGSVVISSSAKIGNNCNISQGVTIGYNSRGARKGHPVIGNNVYIGPGAVVIGNLIVHDNVAIGANAVVLNDCERDCVVVGVPAKAISNNGSEGYIVNEWNLK